MKLIEKYIYAYTYNVGATYIFSGAQICNSYLNKTLAKCVAGEILSASSL